MARLLDRSKAPLSGCWFWVDANTQRPFVSTISFDDLMLQILDYHKEIGRVVSPDLPERVDTYMADRVPKSFVSGDQAGPPVPDHFLVLEAIERVLGAGGDRADERLVGRRILTCRGCPLHDFAAGLRARETRERLAELWGTSPLDFWVGLCLAHNVPCAALAHMATPPAKGCPGCWIGRI